LQTFALLF